MRVTAWVLAGLVGGCGFLADDVRSEITMLDGKRCQASAGTSAGAVEVFFGAHLPERTFTRIAYLEVVADESRDTAELLTELRNTAAQCGADAVVDVDKKFAVRTVSDFFVDDEDVEEQGVLTGVAIVYGDPPPAFERWED